ncbi:MAG: glycoside hydrolase family 32 protein [Chryseolinea sp.]
MKINYILFCLLTLLMGCKPKTSNNNREAKYSEKYRPQFHFTPEKNWINDPNGLVFYEGEYHLFYQYNPYGDKWGHMSWGHAVSKDMLHWEHLPIALEEYLDPKTNDSTMIFSGTAVVDKNNTSGLCEGKDCLVAIYTSYLHKNNTGLRQHQSLAYSNDKGRTWKRYDKNPILDIQRKDFRDPKVFWYEFQQKWVMVLVVPDLYKVQLYQSKNLLQWDLMSEFGKVGDTTKIWECPDLYQLPVENESGKSKWVLSLSGGHPAGPAFVGMQYFIGEFDGTKFISTQKEAKYIDHGKDFYAGIVYNNVNDRTVMIGWINNWTYANEVPTSTWRGGFSLPRQLSLKRKNDEYFLLQKTIAEAKSLRSEEIKDLEKFNGSSLEIELEWNGADGTILELFSNRDEKTVIAKRDNIVFVNRAGSGIVDFQSDFASNDQASIDGTNQKLSLHIFVDQSIIEVFVNDGEASITSQVFPRGENTIVIPMKENVKSIRAWELKSIWK